MDYHYDISIPENDELINRVKTEAMEKQKNDIFGLNLSSLLCLDSICLNPPKKNSSADLKLEDWEKDTTMVYAAGNMGGIVNLIFWKVEPEEILN